MTDRIDATLATLLLPLVLFACGGEGGSDAGTSGEASLTGEVVVDGSSTVFPVSEAVAEEFQKANPRARITVGQSGTGGGFKRFCAGDIDVSDASRPIKEGEIEDCRAAGVDYVELPVAWDGLSVVTNPANDFVECLTMEELRRVWRPDSDVTTWSDVRPEWPDEPIELYGPGTDSGTFDYFTEEVVGESGASRADYQASEDDNVLVQGVAGDGNSLGYFGYAYVVENRDRLKLLGVDGGDGCVLPSDETIESGAYPLARPLYIYVSRPALEDPTVRAFADFYMEHAAELVPPTGYHPLSQEAYERNLAALAGETSGAEVGEEPGMEAESEGAASDGSASDDAAGAGEGEEG